MGYVLVWLYVGKKLEKSDCAMRGVRLKVECETESKDGLRGD